MPRPCKKRKVCGHPGEKLFGPKGVQAMKTTTLTVDEYETLRLIDVEGLTQEECAKSMDVARSTVQAIYSSARGKLSFALVNDTNIIVTGGDYVICHGGRSCCHKNECCHKNTTEVEK